MAYAGKTGGRALNRFLANQGLIQTLDSNQANIASADIGEINAGVINATDSTVVDLSAINLNVANEFVSETIVTSNATFTNINTTGATITDGTIATLTSTSGYLTNADITNLYALNGQIPNATLGTTTATSLVVNGNITFTGSISGNVEAEAQENIDQRISANDADISALQIDLTDVSQRLFDSQNQDDADLTDLSARVFVNEGDITDVSQRLFDSQNQDDADLTDLSARVFVNEGDITDVSQRLFDSQNQDDADLTDLSARVFVNEGDMIDLRDFSTDICNDYLRLDGGTMTGNLGIGTTSGSNALHVNGTTKSSHITSDTITVGRTDISNGFNSFEVDGNARVYGELRVDGSLNLGANTITLIDDGDGTLRLQHTNGTGVIFDLATDNPSIKPLLTTHTDSKVLIDNTAQENTNPQLDLASEGRVGIGTTDASGSLHISGDTYITNGKLMIGSNTEPTYDADIQGIIRSINSAYLATNSGNVGIGTTNPQHKLDVDGTMRATGATTLGGTLDVTGVTNINNTTESSSSSTGALVVDGGVGIAKTLNVGGNVLIAKTGIDQHTDLQINAGNSIGNFDGNKASLTLTTRGAIFANENYPDIRHILDPDGNTEDFYRIEGGHTKGGGSAQTITITRFGFVSDPFLNDDPGYYIVDEVPHRISDTTESSSSSTGALVVDGGVGIAKNLHVNGNVHFDTTNSSTTSNSLQWDMWTIASVGYVKDTFNITVLGGNPSEYYTFLQSETEFTGVVESQDIPVTGIYLQRWNGFIKSDTTQSYDFAIGTKDVSNGAISDYCMVLVDNVAKAYEATNETIVQFTQILNAGNVYSIVIYHFNDNLNSDPGDFAIWWKPTSDSVYEKMVSTDFYNGNGFIFNRDDSRVGINTLVPSVDLDVNGQAKIRNELFVGKNKRGHNGTIYLANGDRGDDYQSSYGNSVIRSQRTPAINDNAEVTELVLFKGNNAESSDGPDRIRMYGVGGIIFDVSGTTNNNSSPSFGVGNDISNGTRAMTILSDGNVGIGTTTPAYKLDVNGDSRIIGDMTVDNGATTTITVWGNDGVADNKNNIIIKAGADNGVNNDMENYIEHQWYPGQGTSPNYYRTGINRDTFTTIHRYAIKSENGEHLSILASGNVGIGTTTPAYKLDVNGTVNATGATTLGGTLDVTGVTNINNTTESSSSSTGALVVDGGVGIAKNLHVNGSLSVPSNITSSNLIMKRSASGQPTDILFQNEVGEDRAKISFGGTAEELSFHTNNTERIRIENGGNVGIGTTTPDYKLDVNGDSRIIGDMTVDNGATTTITVWGNDGVADNKNNIIIKAGADISSIDPLMENYIEHQWYPGQGTSPNYYRTGINRDTFTTIRRYAIKSENGEHLSILASGNVGIGTTAPGHPLEVVDTQSVTPGGTGYQYGTTGQASYSGTGIFVSAKFSNTVWATVRFVASSDKRIKQNINHISDSNALDLFRTIQPRTYEYIDKHSRGTNTVYGFIAQEVKDVIPNAVTITKNIIPDYYKSVKYDVSYTTDLSGEISNGTLVIEHDISYNVDASHNVRLYVLDDSDQERKIDTIPQIIDDTHFSIQSDEIKDVSGVFLYGKEVDDFHTLNKDAIWTVASAALQEVDRNVEKLRKKNHTVRGNISLVDSSGSITLPLEETEFTNPQVFLQNNDGWSQVKGSISGNTLTVIAKDPDCTNTIDYMVVVDLIE